MRIGIMGEPLHNGSSLLVRDGILDPAVMPFLSEINSVVVEWLLDVCSLNRNLALMRRPNPHSQHVYMMGSVVVQGMKGTVRLRSAGGWQQQCGALRYPGSRR